MQHSFLLLLVCLVAAMRAPLAAPIETFHFDTVEQEQAFHRLSEELRCLVCQNQSIAESNADLARDLRHEIHEMLLQGKSEQQIIDFMVARYGDYVLYRPPFKPLTWLLWLGPAIGFFIALWYAIVLIRRQAARAEDAPPPLDAAERERLKALQAAMREPEDKT